MKGDATDFAPLETCDDVLAVKGEEGPLGKDIERVQQSPHWSASPSALSM